MFKPINPIFFEEQTPVEPELDTVDIRFECLRLALGTYQGEAQYIIRHAKDFEHYVLGTEPPVAH